MSSITTRGGDKGRTRLYSGEEVSKRDLPPQAVGALDEAVSVLGIARSHAGVGELHDELLALQRACFVVGAELATHPGRIGRLRERVDAEFMAALDTKRDALEGVVRMPKGFVVPGSDPLAAHLDHARTIFRRCERVAVELAEEGFLQNPLVVQWLNRVSDLLWLMAREVEGAASVPSKAPKD